MNKRRLGSLIVFSLLLVPLFGCGRRHSADELYYLITVNVQVPYWQSAAAGFSQAASTMKVRTEFTGPDSYNPKAQQQALQEAIQKKATGILISVADPNLIKDDIDRAIAAGIPVIAIDSDAPQSKRLFFIGTNNYQAGLAGGQRLVKELQGKGNVVVFTMPTQPNLEERLRGYRDGLEGSRIKITRLVDIKGDPRIAFDTTNTILGKERDKINGFICLEAQAGKEVATVLSENHITDKVVMAFDSDPDTLDWIRKGVIAATISQKPYTMAYVGLQMLDNLYHHKLKNLSSDWSKDSFAPIPAFVDTGSSLVDKSNVDAFVQASRSVAGAQR